MHDGTIVTVRDAADAYKRLAAVHARTRYNPGVRGWAESTLLSSRCCVAEGGEVRVIKTLGPITLLTPPPPSPRQACVPCARWSARH